jgi:hypothetical protein
MSELSVPRPRLAGGHSRSHALEHAAAYAARAPSVHNSRPWQISVSPSGMAIRADRTRQLRTLDPRGRELVRSVGAALFNARVALAERGWASEITRLPDRDDPDLLAEVRPVPGSPNHALAALAPVVVLRRTNRRRFTAPNVPDAALRRLTAIAELEGVLFIPVVDDGHRRLITRLTQQADAVQNADRAFRAQLRHRTTRAADDFDGVPARVGPSVNGRLHDDGALRDLGTGAAGELLSDTSDADRTMVLLATWTDDQLAWLRAGEAMQHVQLELTRLGWVAGPLPQVIEVPLTRTQLRAALTWGAHPQILLRIGSPAPIPGTPPRQRSGVVLDRQLPSGPAALPVERTAGG